MGRVVAGDTRETRVEEGGLILDGLEMNAMGPTFDIPRAVCEMISAGACLHWLAWANAAAT